MENYTHSGRDLSDHIKYEDVFGNVYNGFINFITCMGNANITFYDHILEQWRRANIAPQYIFSPLYGEDFDIAIELDLQDLQEAS